MGLANLLGRGFMFRRLLPVTLALLVFSPRLFAAVPCETLSTLKLPNTTITMAQVVEAGKFVAPAPPRGAPRGENPDAVGRGDAAAPVGAAARGRGAAP